MHIYLLYRLSEQLYGFELHVYNKSHMYKDLEIKFGLEPGILPRQVCGNGDVEHLKFVLIVLKWCNEKIR